MTVIDYKILFEVRVLHDYYLYGIDPLEPNKEVTKSFFEMNAAARMARLQELLRTGRYDIRKDLDFVTSTAERDLSNGLHLRIVKTATGVSVAMEVKSVESNGEARFGPAIEPAEDTSLRFGIRCVNPLFWGFTNMRLEKDSIYFFSNNGAHEGMSLAARLEELESGRQYRMGDLAMIGGVSFQAIADNKGNSNAWERASGTGLVHQEDRSLGTDEGWFRDWQSTIPRGSTPLLGVIQITLKNGNGKFSPLDENGLLATRRVPGKSRPVHPVFELRFGGRTTYWRYRKMGGFSEADVKTIQKEAGQLLDRSGDDFVTKKPREFALEMPPLMPSEREARFRIPNAQPGLFSVGGGKLYSDVYFNNVPEPK